MANTAVESWAGGFATRFEALAKKAKKANTAVAALNAGISIVLAVLWVVLLLAPVPWMSAQLTIFNYSISLLHVRLSHGKMKKLVKKLAQVLSKQATEWLEKHVDQKVWIWDWAATLCDWYKDLCAPWKSAAFGSMVMLVLGLLAAVLLGAGGSLGYYYVQSRAAHVGRMVSTACFFGAQCCVMSGLFLYVLLTRGADFTATKYIEKRGSYDTGLFLASALGLLTCMPLLIHVNFVKADISERHASNGSCSVELPELPQSFHGPGTELVAWQPPMVQSQSFERPMTVPMVGRQAGPPVCRVPSGGAGPQVGNMLQLGAFGRAMRHLVPAHSW